MVFFLQLYKTLSLPATPEHGAIKQERAQYMFELESTIPFHGNPPSSKLGGAGGAHQESWAEL